MKYVLIISLMVCNSISASQFLCGVGKQTNDIEKEIRLEMEDIEKRSLEQGNPFIKTQKAIQGFDSKMKEVFWGKVHGKIREAHGKNLGIFLSAVTLPYASEKLYSGESEVLGNVLKRLEPFSDEQKKIIQSELASSYLQLSTHDMWPDPIADEVAAVYKTSAIFLFLLKDGKFPEADAEKLSREMTMHAQRKLKGIDTLNKMYDTYLPTKVSCDGSIAHVIVTDDDLENLKRIVKMMKDSTVAERMARQSLENEISNSQRDLFPLLNFFMVNHYKPTNWDELSCGVLRSLFPLTEQERQQIDTFLARSVALYEIKLVILSVKKFCLEIYPHVLADTNIQDFMEKARQEHVENVAKVMQEGEKIRYVAAYLQLTNYWQAYTILMNNEQFRTWAESLQKEN